MKALPYVSPLFGAVTGKGPFSMGGGGDNSPTPTPRPTPGYDTPAVGYRRPGVTGTGY